jgi:GNAT superfamily N-acetyltransferase
MVLPGAGGMGAIMEAREYRVVPYSAACTGQILKLQQHLWGRREAMNRAYFEWKYLRNPYIPEPLIYLAVHGDEAVSMRGFVGSEWEFGSSRQTVSLPLTSDVVTAPDHRRRGLMKRVLETALEDLERKDYSYVLSMAAVGVTCETHRATGWRTIGCLRPKEFSLVRPNPLPAKPIARLRALLDRSGLASGALQKLREAGNMISAVARDPVTGFREPRWKGWSRHITCGSTPRAQEMAKLKRQLTGDARIRHVHDATYLEWRFQNPRNRYRFVYWDESALEGYLVLQSCAFPTSQPLGIVDWEASSDEIRLQLLRAALRLVEGRAVWIWSGTLLENALRVLDLAGFQPRASTAHDPQTAEVRAVDEHMLNREWRLGEQSLLDLHNWDFRMLHSRAF